jgi:phage regulator Rha-like protein
MSEIMNMSAMRMTSQEIADLVEKRHDNVKRTIETLAEQGVIAFPQIEEKPTAGRPVQVFVFTGEQGKRDSIIVVAQLSPEFTARLVDRWQELEAKQGQSALNPANLSRLQLIQMAMEAEQEKLELEEKVAEQAPKVDVHDRIADAAGSLCLRDAAKALQVQPLKLNRWLEMSRWIYRRPGKGGYIAYQDKIQAGYLTHKVTPYEDSNTGEQKVSEQVRVTGKGLTALANKLNVDVGPLDVPVGMLGGGGYGAGARH